MVGLDKILRFCLPLAMFTHVVYNYARLDSMSNREATVYGAALALAIVFSLIPFSKLIKIGYFVIIPWLFNKTEQQDQEIADVKEIAVNADAKAEQALAMALQAKENMVVFEPMTEQEIIDMAAKIFGE